MEGVRKDYSPIRVPIIDDLHIQLLPDILGEISFILLHIRESQALCRIREPGLVKFGVAVPGNKFTCVRIDDVHIHLIRMLASAQSEGNPACSAQLEGAGTKLTCRSLVILQSV
ncbi:hypothetical protein D3C73_842680 [compost metagenome]